LVPESLRLPHRENSLDRCRCPSDARPRHPAFQHPAEPAGAADNRDAGKQHHANPAAGLSAGKDPSTTQAPTDSGWLRWPKPLTEQVQALRQVLSTEPAPADAAQLARRVAEILETLVALGQARSPEPGKYAV